MEWGVHILTVITGHGGGGLCPKHFAILGYYRELYLCSVRENNDYSLAICAKSVKCLVRLIEFWRSLGPVAGYEYKWSVINTERGEICIRLDLTLACHRIIGKLGKTKQIPKTASAHVACVCSVVVNADPRGCAYIGYCAVGLS